MKKSKYVLNNRTTFFIILSFFCLATVPDALAQTAARPGSTQGPTPPSKGAATAINLMPESILVQEVPQIPPKAIETQDVTDPLEKRFDRKITLDIRDMNILDVIKFLASKGDFNIVTSPNVTGRVTLLLKRVSIRDALDIVLIANNLAYNIENEIVYVMSGAEYEMMYGKKFSDKTVVDIIRLKYAKPSYVLASLESIKSAVGKVIIDEDTGSVVLIDTPKALEEMKKTIETIENPLETFIYKVQFAKADVVAEKLRSRLEANTVGSIVPDERSNQLLIRAFPERRKEVEELIKTLDVKTKEVLIEARVLQVTFKPQFDMGIDWDFDFRDSQDPQLQKVSFKNVALNESGLTSSDALRTIYGKIALGDFPTDAFEMSIRALKQVSDTKILSNPRLLVVNNEESKIHIGDTVPYIISTTSGTGDNAITSEDVRFVDVGLILAVTPNINDDGFVTMRLKPEISTVVTRITSQGGGIPQISKTLVETTVMVKDGTTVILGGLKKQDKSHVKKGIPGLSDLPWVGRLFGAVSDTVIHSEIVIFITPHIMTGEEGYKQWKGSIKPYKTYEDKNGYDLKEETILSPKSQIKDLESESNVVPLVNKIE